MRYGIFFAYWSTQWHGDYVKYAQKVKGLGFDILEISAGSLPNMTDSEIDRLRAVSRDLDLQITSNLGPPKDRDVASKDAAIRESGVRYLTDIMKAMDRLDSRTLAGVINTSWPCRFDDMDKPAMWERSVKSVKRLGQIASDLGIDYCVEVVNRFETTMLNTCEEAVRYCREVDCDSVKILLDTFHMNIEEDRIADAIRLAGDRLGHVHVGEGNRKLPGQGSLPWAEIGLALKDIGYSQGVVMEPFVRMGGQVGLDIKVFRDLSDGATEAGMDNNAREALDYLKRQFENPVFNSKL